MWGKRLQLIIAGCLVLAGTTSLVLGVVMSVVDQRVGDALSIPSTALSRYTLLLSIGGGAGLLAGLLLAYRPRNQE